MHLKETEALVQKAVYAELSADEELVFKQHFKGDLAFRQCYYDHVFLVTSLHSTSTLQKITRGKNRLQTTNTREVKRIGRASLLWAAAAAILIGVIGYFTILPQKIDSAPKIVKLAFSDGTRWKLENNSPSKNQTPDDSSRDQMSPQMHAGSTLSLDQGVAEISFPSGAKTILSGDSKLTYYGKNRFHLHHGKVTFSIPDSANDIELTTPRIKVVDIGTKFGVVSIGELADEVHVIEGVVEITTKLALKQSRNVHAGSAASIDYLGRITEIAPVDNKFLWKLPRAIPHLHWSFNSLDADKLSALGEHPMLSEIHSTYQSSSAMLQDRVKSGPYGNGISFTQSGDYISTTYPGVSGGAPRTLSVWLRLPPEMYQASDPNNVNWSSVIGWGRRDFPNQRLKESIQLIVGESKISPGKNKGKIIPVLSFENIWFEGQTQLADGKWHHVVWVFEEKNDAAHTPEVICYLDGKLEPILSGVHPQTGYMKTAATVNTITDSEDSFPLTIGTSLIPNRLNEPPLRLELDELYVIEGVISHEDALLLYRENSFTPAEPMKVSPESEIK